MIAVGARCGACLARGCLTYGGCCGGGSCSGPAIGLSGAAHASRMAGTFCSRDTLVRGDSLTWLDMIVE
jgi:hypothetical protein